VEQATVVAPVTPAASEFTTRSIGMLVASVVTLMLSGGVLSVGATVFFLPMTQEFTWTQTQYTFFNMIATYACALTGFFLGRATDRWGVRKVVLPTAFYTAWPVMGLSLLDGSVAQATLLYGLAGVGTATAVCYFKLTASYFHRRFGLALAIFGTAAGLLMGAMMPPAMQALLTEFGWRQSFVIWGAAYLLVAFPIQFWFARDPEPTSPVRADHDTSPQSIVAGANVGAALRSTAIWIILATDLIAMMVTSATRVHIVPLFVERGLDANTAIGVLAAAGLGMLIARPITGWCLDRFDSPRIVLPFAVMAALSIAALAFGGSMLSMLFLGMLFVGIGAGMESGAGNYLLGRYYGRRHYGQLAAIIYVAIPLGIGLGPVLVGYLHDRTGSYEPGLLALLGLSLLCVVLTALLRPYRYSALGKEATLAT
jgi:MFS family permease